MRVLDIAPFMLLAIAALPARDRTPAEETFVGSIDSVEQMRCQECNCVEVDLVLKTDKGRVRVKLGPKHYLEQRDFALFRADIVSVTGLRFREHGNTIVLATEIRKGGDTLVLRGKHGRPGWLEKHGHTCPVCAN